MSSRALRKAQRQQQEEQFHQQADKVDDDVSDEEPAPAGKASIFAMLNQAAGDDEELDEQGHDDNEDVDEPVPEHESTTEIIQPVSSPKSTPKKKKKKKKPKSATPTPDSDQDFEFLGKGKPVSTAKGNMNQSTPTEELCQLLSVSQQNLHVLNEMKNLFGRDVIEAEEREARAVAMRARRGGRKAVNYRLATLARRKNIFIQGKEEWPAVSFGGLGMEVVETKRNGIVEYRFVHSTAYQDVQRQFELCVQSMDPHRMILLLEHNPWHIATLLQVSDIAKQSRQHSDAGDLLERALYSFGRSIHSTFGEMLAQGKARLDFRRPENREFWLASWHYIDNLRMRSTWRTVYEWTKMLLSLDPEKDPYCLKLVIDQFALRARQQQHFLHLISNKQFNNAVYAAFGLASFQPELGHQEEMYESKPRQSNRYPLVNIAASKALAHLQLDQPTTAESELSKAMADSPWLFTCLFHELQIEPIPPSIWGKQPPGPNEDLAAKLYISRAKDIWNTPESMALLVKVAKALKLQNWQPEPEPPIPLFEQQAPVRHVVLHVMLTEQPQFIGLLPNRPTNQQLRSSDPYPPVNNLPSYGETIRSMPSEEQMRAMMDNLLREEFERRARRGDEQPDNLADVGDGTERATHIERGLDEGYSDPEVWDEQFDHLED